MTEENYNDRTSQTLLRNQFPGPGERNRAGKDHLLQHTVPGDAGGYHLCGL